MFPWASSIPELIVLMVLCPQDLGSRACWPEVPMVLYKPFVPGHHNLKSMGFVHSGSFVVNFKISYFLKELRSKVSIFSVGSRGHMFPFIG